MRFQFPVALALAVVSLFCTALPATAADAPEVVAIVSTVDRNKGIGLDVTEVVAEDRNIRIKTVQNNRTLESAYIIHKAGVGMWDNGQQTNDKKQWVFSGAGLKSSSEIVISGRFGFAGAAGAGANNNNNNNGDALPPVWGVASVKTHLSIVTPLWENTDGLTQVKVGQGPYELFAYVTGTGTFKDLYSPIKDIDALHFDSDLLQIAAIEDKPGLFNVTPLAEGITAIEATFEFSDLRGKAHAKLDLNVLGAGAAPVDLEKFLVYTWEGFSGKFFGKPGQEGWDLLRNGYEPILAEYSNATVVWAGQRVTLIGFAKLHDISRIKAFTMKNVGTAEEPKYRRCLLMGYSYGGNTAVEVARDLDKINGYSLSHVRTIDPVRQIITEFGEEFADPAAVGNGNVWFNDFQKVDQKTFAGVSSVWGSSVKAAGTNKEWSVNAIKEAEYSSAAVQQEPAADKVRHAHFKLPYIVEMQNSVTMLQLENLKNNPTRTSLAQP